MSPILFPGLAYFIPSKKAAFVTSTNLCASFDVFPPHINVRAASPLNPFFSITVSTLTKSPSLIILFFTGIPCITSC